MSNPVTKDYLCKFCNFLAHDSDQLKAHQSNQHKEYKCSICHQKFLNLKCIRSHIKAVHLVNLTCQICDKSFANHVEYVSHARLHLNITSDVSVNSCEKEDIKLLDLKAEECKITISPSTRPEPILRKCLFCEFTTYDIDALDEHVQSHIMIKILKCEDCGILFENESLLEKHRKSHKAILYQCGICEKSSSSKEDIIIHVKKKHVERECIKKQAKKSRRRIKPISNLQDICTTQLFLKAMNEDEQFSGNDTS